MDRYVYEGPVKIYGQIVNYNWRGETYAPTAEKARSNLQYQYKQQTGKAKNLKIIFTGKVEKENLCLIKTS